MYYRFRKKEIEKKHINLYLRPRLFGVQKAFTAKLLTIKLTQDNLSYSLLLTDFNKDGKLEWKDFDMAREVCKCSRLCTVSLKKTLG